MYAGLSGYFRLVVRGPSGDVKRDTGWFSNLITNQGLDWFGVAPTSSLYDPLAYCFVGTGNTPPTFTDTTLTAPLTPAAGRTHSTSSYLSGTPPYYSFLATYQWAQGDIIANLAEVGVGSVLSPPNGSPIVFNHALIVDANGNPTTLSVLSTDTLSISYELRLYLNTTDTNYSLIIGGVTYSGIYRLANLNTPAFIPYTIPSTNGGSDPFIQYFSGAIGPITGIPSGPGPSGNPTQISWTFSTYTKGSYTIQMTSNIPANSQGAINVTAITLHTLLGMWQFSVSPSWNRLSTQNISTTWALSWGRY